MWSLCLHHTEGAQACSQHLVPLRLHRATPSAPTATHPAGGDRKVQITCSGVRVIHLPHDSTRLVGLQACVCSLNSVTAPPAVVSQANIKIADTF